MNATDTENLAALAMRLRHSTEMTPVLCMDVLRPLSPELRRLYVEYFEANPSSLLHDPIEFDPRFERIINAVGLEAKRKLEAGELGDGRRGRSIRMWGWMKEELAQRYKITWRTPLEMTPGVALD